MGAQAPHRWDERAVRSTRHSVCSKSTPTPGESGGQGCCCCHDNPSGRGPRGLGPLPGGRRRRGQGRPLSVASARPRVPCSVPEEAGAAVRSAPRAQSLRPRCSAGWQGPGWQDSPTGLPGGQPQSGRTGLRLLRVAVWNFLSPWGPDARLGAVF